MANLLKMAMMQSILALYERGWSRRRIARELGIDRATVTRVLRRSVELSNAANAPTGSVDAVCSSNAANAPIGSPADSVPGNAANAPIGSGDGVDCGPSASGPPRASQGSEAGNSGLDPANDLRISRITSADGSERLQTRPDFGSTLKSTDLPTTPLARRPSGCEPWRQLILEKLQLGLTAKRIHQDLMAEHGAEMGYDSLRRFLRRLDPQWSLPFRRIESAPGEEAQVDFGSAAPVLGPDGKRRRTHLFRVVLSHSRKGYSEAVYRQTTEEFIRCVENSFWHFGGVPRTLVIDNLRAAVSQADWFDPELNPKLQSFCRHYQVTILPTKPRMARHKGKVERGVGYAQDNGLKGRRFLSLAEQNRHLLDWEATIADTRIHGTTRRQVAQLFREVERPRLQPLPTERFPFFHEGQRIVHRDGHVEVAKAYYSVPPEYLAREVWVRWDARMVRIYNSRMQQIAAHLRHEPGRFSTLGEHIATEKISNIERGAEWLLAKAGHIGPQSRRWAQQMLEARGIAGIRVVLGLLSLAKRHSHHSIEQACTIALTYSAFRLRTIRRLLKHPGPKQEPIPFLDEHPIIRPMREYAVRFSGQPTNGATQWVFSGMKGVRSHEDKKAPDPPQANPGPRALSAHPPGYPSPGCSPAEPDSVSPGISNIVQQRPVSKESHT